MSHYLLIYTYFIVMGEKQAETDKRIDEHKQELAGKQKNI